MSFLTLPFEVSGSRAEVKFNCVDLDKRLSSPLLHSGPVAGASTQASLVRSVIVKAVVAENTTCSSGCWQIVQTICIQLCWLDLYFCPELCFQRADSPLKCKGVTKHEAEDMWGTYYVIFDGILKKGWNKVNPFWKAWPVLALKGYSDKVLPNEAWSQQGPRILCSPWNDIHLEFSLR